MISEAWGAAGAYSKELYRYGEHVWKDSYVYGTLLTHETWAAGQHVVHFFEGGEEVGKQIFKGTKKVFYNVPNSLKKGWDDFVSLF
jgi:hypothetical protein